MSKYRKEISQEEFEQIERYLLNRMDVAEQAKFERLLSADNVLRDEVTLQRRLMSAVETGAFRVGTVAGQQDKAAIPMRKLVPYWRYVAVAVLVFGIGLTGWWFYGQQTAHKEDLYAAYFRPDVGLPVVMSSDSAKYLFNEGMVSYKEGNYEDAIDIWKQLVAENGAMDTLHYYIGVAYLNMENHADASNYLALISENEHSVFREKAIWYLALIKLKEKDYVRAKRLLMKLSEKEEAVELLDQIAD